MRNFELLQISREKSRKTEAVFLVGSRRSGGKSKSLRARFLLPAFSFGEAKENAVPQLQISESVLTLTSASLTTKYFGFAADFRKTSASRRAEQSPAPTKIVHIFRGASKLAAFESPQALRASSP